ncbi:J domain-containing protein [Sabulibacter ruber]|uniref:J domain-containing protein n=1 Tax=Sabulibacter ruber TaxID=2811901 RepID=UPI001A95CB6E|nr:J domain-containing protein [Sabulibacter ruber]
MLAESYRVLGVPFGAGMPQIRRAYRQLALQYHPDRNQDPGAPAMFLRIQAAYEYLQRFQEVASAQPSSPTSAPPPPPPKPQSDWEKYQYVYEPPTDPKEYIAWAAVARERVRRQKEKDHADYVKRTLAFKKKWWYGIALLGSYAVWLAGLGTSLLLLMVPVFFIFLELGKSAVLGCLTVPMGLVLIKVMRDLRQDIRKHFGEDLTESSK